MASHLMQHVVVEVGNEQNVEVSLPIFGAQLNLHIIALGLLHAEMFLLLYI